MRNYLLIRVIILLVSTALSKTSPYVCDKNRVPCGCGQTNVGINARIVNGENAIPNSWPMMVSLQIDRNTSQHNCGGTILTESYILTAAHCVDMDLLDFSLEELKVVAGVHSLSQTDQIIRRVDQIIIHPSWKEFRILLQYDIAILHLTEPLDLERNSTLTRTCLPARLNTEEEILQYPLNGTALVAIGWGRLETNGDSPDVLQQVSVHLIHHFDRICANMISDPTVNFCVGLYEGGKGACQGDSGGPIFQWMGDRWEQVGIASYGGKEGCAVKGYTTVYTRISYFHDWITSHIRDNTTTNHRVLYPCYMPVQECGCSHRSVALSPSTMVKSENALPHSWSMIVSIRVGASDEHICSGTVLEKSYVLTTAHCLAHRSTHDMTIEGGMYSRSETGAEIPRVKRIFVHPNYAVHSNIFINDIAIIEVIQPFNITDYDSGIARTCLPSGIDQPTDPDTYLSNGTRLAISGWDILNKRGSIRSPILRQAEIYVIDDENLNCSLSNGQYPDQFCAGRYENVERICDGDNFSDPIFQWNDSHWIQVGLGSRCGMSGKLAVFTNLSAYSDWMEYIQFYTAENSSHLYQCDKKAPCGCGQTNVNLTVTGMTGGETAVESSWPMVVSVQYQNSHWCAGTILSDSFVLTSADCVSFGSGTYWSIVAGIHILTEPVVIRRKIDQIYIHPNFSRYEVPHDIAIVHLDQPLPLGDTSSILAKTCAPSHSASLTNDYPKENSSLVVVGWDITTLDNRSFDGLQQLSIRMLDHKYKACRRFNFSNAYQFCAGLAGITQNQKMKYLCKGGAGGPVLIFKNDHWEQVGIIQEKRTCTYVREGAIFTRLSPYLEWIKDITNSSETISPTLPPGLMENVTKSSSTTFPRPSPEQTENVMNSSTTISSSTNKNNAFNNQGYNNIIFAILSLFVVILLM